MSPRHSHSQYSGDTSPPLSFTESGKWKFDQKTLLGLILLTVTITVGWMNIKADVLKAQSKSDAVEERLGKIEVKLDTLLYRNDIKR